MKAYRLNVKQLVLGVIDRIPIDIQWDSEMWVVLMGIEH